MEKSNVLYEHNNTILENNNKTILNVQALNICVISAFLILRYTYGLISFRGLLYVLLFTLIQIVVPRIIWYRYKKSTLMRKFISFSFLLYYFICLYYANCGAVYTLCLPMIVVSTLYSHKIRNVIYTSSYSIIYVIAIIYGYYSGKFGYIDSDTMIVQISSLSTITIATILTFKSHQINMNNSVKEIKSSYSNVYYAATHDVLTGLYNRNYLMMNHETIINFDKSPIALIIININGLKLINEFRGNAIGDKIIKRVGVLLVEAVPERYIPLRLDGDEFMIIMHSTYEEKAIELAEYIRSLVNNEKEDGIDMSIEYGIAIMDSKNTSLDSCMAIAKNNLYKKKLLNKDSVRSSLIESLKKSLSESDFETEEHAERTKTMSEKLGKRLGLTDKEQSELGLLAILHDIGKLSIPREILTKPGKLNTDEWEIMKTHTNKGYEIAKSAPELKQIAEYILHHHERWDGKGYPDGLSKDDIPLLSRIITVIDSHDVMTHDRPYHKAMSEKDAIEELKKCSGTQFDPEIVKEFIELLHNEKQQNM